MTPTEYLKKPYGRVVLPEPDGTFRSEIIEFPGCIAVGDTASEALANLERVASSWLEATLAKGQRVPDPIDSIGFSGKLVLRLPKSLHRKAANAAARDGVSLNQFIVSSVAEQVGTRARPVVIYQTARANLNLQFAFTSDASGRDIALAERSAASTAESPDWLANIDLRRADARN